MSRTSLAVLLAAGLGLVSVRDAAVLAASAQSATAPDVIYVPTPQPVVEAMLAIAGVNQRDVVYDLGSGDGRIVITAAKKYGARGVGIEIDPALVKKATDNAAAAGVSDRVRFVAENFFTSDISEATVVTLYLLQSLNERLRPKLARELNPGTRIVSHVFNMGPEWPPQKTLTVERSRIFLWTIPDRGLHHDSAVNPPESPEPVWLASARGRDHARRDRRDNGRGSARPGDEACQRAIATARRRHTDGPDPG